jgi:hypothetical protein
VQGPPLQHTRAAAGGGEVGERARMIDGRNG